jgi:two-component system response regulator GlrR
VEKKRILVVDDDETILKSFKDILESRGYLVDTAETGLEALEKSEVQHYDLVLLDIKLPDIEGTELLVEMHEGTPRMMKVMVTGHASLENAVESLNLGADAYLIKPVRPEELLRVVAEKLMEQEEAERMSEDKVAEWIESRLRKLQDKPKR